MPVFFIIEKNKQNIKPKREGFSLKSDFRSIQWVISLNSNLTKSIIVIYSITSSAQHLMYIREVPT